MKKTYSLKFRFCFDATIEDVDIQEKYAPILASKQFFLKMHPTNTFEMISLTPFADPSMYYHWTGRLKQISSHVDVCSYSNVATEGILCTGFLSQVLMIESVQCLTHTLSPKRNSPDTVHRVSRGPAKKARISLLLPSSCSNRLRLRTTPLCQMKPFLTSEQIKHFKSQYDKISGVKLSTDSSTSENKQYQSLCSRYNFKPPLLLRVKENMFSPFFPKESGRSFLRNLLEKKAGLLPGETSDLQYIVNLKELSEKTSPTLTIQDLVLYYSMLRSLRQLESMGITPETRVHCISPMVERLEDPLFLFLSSYIMKHLQQTSWNMTSSYMLHKTAGKHISVNGSGNPFPREFGVDFQNEKHRISKPNTINRRKHHWQQRSNLLTAVNLNESSKKLLSVIKSCPDALSPDCLFDAKSTLRKHGTLPSILCAWMYTSKPFPVKKTYQDFDLETLLLIPLKVVKGGQDVQTVSGHDELFLRVLSKYICRTPSVFGDLFKCLSPSSSNYTCQEIKTLLNEANDYLVHSIALQYYNNYDVDICTITEPDKKKGTDQDLRRIPIRRLKSICTEMGHTEWTKDQRWTMVNHIRDMVNKELSNKDSDKKRQGLGTLHISTFIRNMSGGVKDREKGKQYLLQTIARNMLSMLRGETRTFSFTTYHDPVKQLLQEHADSERLRQTSGFKQVVEKLHYAIMCVQLDR